MSISLDNELDEKFNDNLQFLVINKNPISITETPFADEGEEYVKGKNLLAITPEFVGVGTTKSVKIFKNVEFQDFMTKTVLADNDEKHSISSLGQDIVFETDVLDIRAVKVNDDQIFVVVLTNGDVHLILNKEDNWISTKQTVTVEIEDIEDLRAIYRLSQNELVYIDKNKQLYQFKLSKDKDYILSKDKILPEYKNIVDFEYKKDLGLVFTDATDLYISKDLNTNPESFSLESLNLGSKDFYKIQIISPTSFSISSTILDEEEIEEELDFGSLETSIITYNGTSLKVIRADLVADSDAFIADPYNVISTTLKGYTPEYDYVTVIGGSKTSAVQLLAVKDDNISLQQSNEDQYNITLPMNEETDDTSTKGLSFNFWTDFNDDLSKKLDFEVSANTPVLYILNNELKLFVYFLVFVENFKSNNFTTDESIKLFEAGLIAANDVKDSETANVIEKEEYELIEDNSSKFITEEGNLVPPTKVESAPVVEEKKPDLLSSMSKIIDLGAKQPVFGHSNESPFAINKNASPFGEFGKNMTLSSGSAFGKPQFTLTPSAPKPEAVEEKKETSSTPSFAAFSSGPSPFATVSNPSEIKVVDAFGKLPETTQPPTGNPFGNMGENPFSMGDSALTNSTNDTSKSESGLNFSHVKDIPPPVLTSVGNDAVNNSYVTVNTSEDIEDGVWTEVVDEKSMYQADETSDKIEEEEKEEGEVEKEVEGDSTIDIPTPEENESLVSEVSDDGKEVGEKVVVREAATATVQRDFVSRGSQIDAEVATMAVQTPVPDYSEGSVIADEKELPSEVLSEAYKYPEIEQMYVVDEKAIWDHVDKDRDQTKEGVFDMMCKMVHLVNNHITALNMNIKTLDKNIKEQQKFTYEKNGIEAVKDKNVNWRLSEIKKINEILDKSFNNQVLSLHHVQDMDVKIADIMKESLILKHDIKKSVDDLEVQLKGKNAMKLSNIEEGLLSSHDAMITNIQTKMKIVEKNLFFLKMYLATKKSVQVNDITDRDVETFLTDKDELKDQYEYQMKPFGNLSHKAKSRLDKKTEIFNRHKQFAKI